MATEQVTFHICTNDRGDLPVACICAIERDHDEDEFQAWEDNNWQDPSIK